LEPKWSLLFVETGTAEQNYHYNTLCKQSPSSEAWHILTCQIQTLQNEMQRVYETKVAKGKPLWQLPDQKISTEGTIFHQRYTTVVIDEAHEMRNLGIKHYGALRIFQQGLLKLALTGTPLLTAPKVSCPLDKNMFS
jgi:TATA-binding protein-associated factor